MPIILVTKEKERAQEKAIASGTLQIYDIPAQGHPIEATIGSFCFHIGSAAITF